MADNRTFTWLLGTVLLILYLPAASSGRPLADGDGPDVNNACRPSQVHIAVTGDPTEMQVMWKTKAEGCSTKVHYGQDLGLVQNAADNDAAQEAPPILGGVGLRSGSVSKYSRHDMCASPARDYDYDPPILHSVTLSGLEPGGKYFYKVAHGGAVSSFQAAAKAGRKQGFQFLVYGDMGDPDHAKAKSPGAKYTRRWLIRDVEGGSDMVLHVGDVSYANGDPEIWDSFMDAIEPIASRVPYMISVGNHEYDYHTGSEKRSRDPSGSRVPYDPDWGNFGNDSGGECGVSVSKRFPMPGGAGAFFADGGEDTSLLGDEAGNGTAGGGGGAAANRHHHVKANPPFWYSYDYGSAHFTVISTEHNLEKGSHQYQWLEQDLAKTDRCRTPWLVLAMHRPMYVVYPHKSNRIVGEHLRRQLEALFNEHRVDLVFSGHVHSYARTCNVLDEACVHMSAGGMTHITLGCGGRKLSGLQHSQPDWLEEAAEHWGYGRVTVHDGYGLTFEYVHSESGKVKDVLKLHNSRADARHCFTSPGDSDSSSPALAPAAAAASEAAGRLQAVAPQQRQAKLQLQRDVSAGGLTQN